jgi:hypothetical protein
MSDDVAGSFTRRSMQLNRIAALRYGVSRMSASVAEAPQATATERGRLRWEVEGEGAEGGGQGRPAVEGGGRW